MNKLSSFRKSWFFIPALSFAVGASVIALAWVAWDAAVRSDSVVVDTVTSRRVHTKRIPRVPIGGPSVIGNAVDDYVGTGHRAVRLSRASIAGSPSEEDRALIADATTQGVVDVFSRSMRREYSTFPTNVRWLELLIKNRLVFAAAQVDFADGKRQRAWRRAAAVVRFARASIDGGLIGSAIGVTTGDRAVGLLGQVLESETDPTQRAEFVAELAVLNTERPRSGALANAILASEIISCRDPKCADASELRRLHKVARDSTYAPASEVEVACNIESQFRIETTCGMFATAFDRQRGLSEKLEQMSATR